MNKWIYGIAAASGIFSAYLNGHISCRDSSNHNPRASYDYKTDHAVDCNCPCIHTRGTEQKCVSCGHYRHPEPLNFYTPSPTKPRSVYRPINPKFALTAMIKRYLGN